MLGAARANAANDKADCAAALKAAQAERTDRKLTKAIADFATCARPVCPKAMQKQCRPDLSAEAVAAQPSVVFSAKDASGNAGAPTRLPSRSTARSSRRPSTARPVTVDPGTHPMKFEMQGATTVNKDIVVAETDKSQPVAIDLDANPPVARGRSASSWRPPTAAGSITDTLEDPTKRYYFLGLRYRADVIPQFMLDIFVNGGKTLFSEHHRPRARHAVRKDNFLASSPALSYTEYGTGDVVFAQKNKDPTPRPRTGRSSTAA